MIKKIYYISFFIFIVSAVLPYKKRAHSFLTPTTEEKTEKLNVTKLEPKRPEYTREVEIEFESTEDNNEDAPTINAESAIVIDMNNKKVLYEKNSELHKPVASLSKIMTAVLAVEYLDLNEKIEISKKASNTGENTMNLQEGEILTVEELLYGLILNSGNDSAVALSEKMAGSEEQFVLMMNEKAKKLSAFNTLFADSSGLNENKKTFYSTANDMAKIAYYSQTTHPELKEIYSTFTKEIPATEEHGYKYLENQTNLLTTYPGVGGMKTGYTEEAGLCLITYAENEGKEVLVVILNSTDRRGDAILLLDHAYNKLGVEVEHDLL